MKAEKNTQSLEQTNQQMKQLEVKLEELHQVAIY